MNKLMAALIWAFLSLVPLGHAAADVKVGVMAPRGALTALNQWSALGAYLETQVGSKVEIVPIDPDQAVNIVAKGEVDYMLTNPAIAVALTKKLGAAPIATLNKKSGSQFAGVIISKKGSGITKAADLKGKKVMGFKFGQSAAAYVFQVKHLLDQGIDPHKDFAVFHEAKKQDDIVLAVKAGAFDAGFVKSGLLEAMAKEGKVSLDDFEIVDRQNDGYKPVHSTILYPEWTFCAQSKADTDMTAKVKAALLKLDPENEASKKANILGFVEPLSLDDLDATLQTLKLAPYDK
jgi:ABC-type phosphate/phosphonate transport system substrate-binding protein